MDGRDPWRAGHALRRIDPVVAASHTAYGRAALRSVCAFRATAGRASKQLVEMWPVGLEGVVSVVLGLLAVVWPFVSRELIYVIAGWGIVTGILEIAFALRVSSRTAGHWLLGTAGVCSLSLALLVLVLPHADIRPVATALGVYALLFGVVMFLAALGFRQRRVAIRVRAAGA